MTETLKKIVDGLAGNLNSVVYYFALMKGYLEGNAAPSEPPCNESLKTLFIENERFKELKKMLINLQIKGSVRKRADGLLELRIWHEGKRRSIYGRTEDELLTKFHLQRRRKRSEQKPALAVETLYTWLDKWVKLYKTDTVKPRTLSAIISCIKTHIRPNFADVPLNRINPLLIEENLKKIASSRMRKYTYQILNEAYKKALQLKIIKENPFALVDVPRHKSNVGKPLTPDEQEVLIKSLESSEYKGYFLFLLYSGCRRCEGLAAQWEDIDWDKKRLFVRGTKTDLSHGYIPLFAKLSEVLKEIQPKNAKGKIFLFSESQVERAFNKLCPNHRIHDLRHTFATNCLEAGVELKAVQAWLRHSKIGTTADIYAHATDKFLMQEAEKINRK